MKIIDVKEIRYWLALFGQSSRSKSICCHLELVVFLPNVTPMTSFPKMEFKTQKFQFSKFLKQKSFLNIHKKKNYWIRNNEKYSIGFSFFQDLVLLGKGLPQTFPRKKLNTSFLSEDQKVVLVIRLFSDDFKI